MTENNQSNLLNEKNVENTVENCNKQEKENQYVQPDGGYGWVIVAAVMLINISVLPLIQCWGLIFDKSDLHSSAAKTSFILHLHSFIANTFSFFFSPLLKTYSFRKMGIFGSVLMNIGILLVSLANSYIFLVSSVVVIGFGQSILMPSTYFAVNTYFKKRLTLATSFTVCGAGLPMVFMPKLCVFLLKNVGRKYTIMSFFGISLVSTICCFLLKPLDIKKEQEAPENKDVQDSLLNDDKVYKSTTIDAPKPPSLFKRISDLFDLQLLLNMNFVIVVIGLGLSFAAELNIILMMQFVLPEISHFSKESVATVTIVQSVFDIVSRLVVPLTSYLFQVADKKMYAIALVVSSVGRSLLAIWNMEKFVVFIAISLVGISKGARAVYQSVIIPRLVPLEKIPPAIGLSMLFTGIVSLMTGPILGVIHDACKSYIPVLHTASGISIFCVLLWAVQDLYKRNFNKKVEETRNVC